MIRGVITLAILIQGEAKDAQGNAIAGELSKMSITGSASAPVGCTWQCYSTRAASNGTYTDQYFVTFTADECGGTLPTLDNKCSALTGAIGDCKQGASWADFGGATNPFAIAQGQTFFDVTGPALTWTNPIHADNADCRPNFLMTLLCETCETE